MDNLDTTYMQRALTLARHGLGFTSPNPMVGAVIVHDNTIIGEGYHRLCGQAHAEVNAVAAVADRNLLRNSTMYVTLEPCSHYGKTPPCANLIIENKIPRVVVGTTDPFSKVSGRGIAMLRDAGVDVTVGIMEHECRSLNATFFTAHSRKSPFVTLKWAQSSDHYMDHRRDIDTDSPARFSTPTTTLLTHRLRSIHDAILTTAATVNADNPLLTVRHWHGRNPKPVIIDRHHTLHPHATITSHSPIIYDSLDFSLTDILSDLYSRHGITSVLVEAGPRLLSAMISQGLWDLIRVETTSTPLGGQGTAPAPLPPAGMRHTCHHIDGNHIDYYINNPLVTII